MMGPAQEPTLGQVNQAAAPPEEDIFSQYQRALQLTQQMYAPGIRQPLPESDAPGLLKNLLTLGGAGKVHADYSRGYNLGVQRYNANLQMLAAKDALDLVQDQAKVKELGSKQNMAMMGLQMRLMGLENQQTDTQLNAIRTRLGLNRESRIASTPGTPDQTAAGAARGLIKDPTTGAWVSRGGGAPIPSTSPLGQKFGELGGDDDAALSGAAGPAALEQARARIKEGSAGRAKEEQEKGKLRAMQKTVGVPVLEQLARMKAATRILPSGSSATGVVGSYTGTTGIMNRLRLKQQGPEGLRDLNTLREGDMLTQQLYRLVAVGVATEQDVEPYKTRMKNLETKTREEAQNDLSQVENFVRLRMNMGQATTAPTSPTTSTTGTTGSGITPGGIKYRVVE